MSRPAKRKRAAAHVISYTSRVSDTAATRPTLHHYTEFETRPGRRISARTSIITAGSALEPTLANALQIADLPDEPASGPTSMDAEGAGDGEKGVDLGSVEDMHHRERDSNVCSV